MDAYGSCSVFGREMNSKAQAITFALSLCTSWSEEQKKNVVDYDEAQKMFHFITKNVTLPDVQKTREDSMMELLTPFIASLKAAQDRASPQNTE